MNVTGGTSRVAVIGAGVSGLTAAYLLQRRYHVTLFEADNRLGGHAHTHHVVDGDGTPIAIDTAFITYNTRAYPLLMRLFGELRVATQSAEMSLSVRCEGCGLEYAGGEGPLGWFAQPASMTDISYLRTLAQIPDFYRHAHALLHGSEVGEIPTLGEFLAGNGYTRHFIGHFVVPLVSAVWSCEAERAIDYPAEYLFTFLAHHGLLSLKKSHGWRTVVGGSHVYVERVAKQLSAVRVGVPVRVVHRFPDGIEIVDETGAAHLFDALVIATHPDQALKLLAHPTADEEQVLGSFSYSKNETILHTDETVLPRHHNAIASWNYVQQTCTPKSGAVQVSYDMNKLQRLNSARRYFVTLNGVARVREVHVLARMMYEHPIYTPQSVSAQCRLPALSNRRWAYAGAYHGWGFHEDGCRSGVDAAHTLGVDWH